MRLILHEIPKPFLAFDNRTHENYAWGRSGWSTNKKNLLSITSGEWGNLPDDLNEYEAWMGKGLTADLIAYLKENKLDISRWRWRPLTLLWLAPSLEAYQRAHGAEWPMQHVLDSGEGEWWQLHCAKPRPWFAPARCKTPQARVKACSLLRDQVILDILAERKEVTV